MKNKLNLNKKTLKSLKAYIRSNASSFLKDHNISSIGIGSKIKDGQRTNQACIQFTVDRKFAPEALLESLNTKEIPQNIKIGDILIPTDILERKYNLSYQMVEDVTVNKRKIKLDPVLPGISISNDKGSAGTLGCIVYDQHNNTPYVLSNWHVLHGNEGEIGDTIVQPGPYDDNRILQNKTGVLVRSYLGKAGDCAISTIEGRAYIEDIYALNTSVKNICEVEFGDKVIKSGRTTNVTHGVVVRTDVVSKINYEGNTGIKEIGCFEIGVDEANKPINGEISSGGDSGALWMIAEEGKALPIMAGLHFAGETRYNPYEYALACYPKSVFEKLEIKLKP
jgi:endonuclease G